MNNRFTITEEEKNRIRGLHKNHSIIKEQSEERNKISMEDYRVIMSNISSKVESMLEGKTVNLWTTTITGGETADGPGTVAGDEVSSLGSWTIGYVVPYSDLDEEAGEDDGSIIIGFEPRRGPEDESQMDMIDTFIDGATDYDGNLSVIWHCGDKSFSTDIDDGNSTSGHQTGRLPSTFTNLKLINKLNSELCNSIEWKEYDKLFSPNGNYVVTDMDVDFSMGDEDIETLA